MNAAQPRPQQPRVVAVAYGTLAMLLIVVVATVALVVRPPVAPAVAEFSPTDPQRIEEAPEGQDSRFGTGGEGTCVGGGCAGGRNGSALGPGATTNTTARIIDGNRVRRCVGDPARQVEDPQSPPCVNYWEGDNGGATATGVTSNEIRVAVRQSGRMAELLAAFFNRRFELYGRTLRLVPLDAAGDPGSPEGQRALAEKADQLRVFAALGFDSHLYDTRPFAKELARRGIVFVDRQSRLTSGELRNGPLWQYSPAIDEAHNTLVRMACSSLAGRQADHGGPAVRVRQRKFAVVHVGDGGAEGPTRELADGLGRCPGAGGSAPLVEMPRNATQDDHRRELAALALDGVTTLVCVCFDADRVAVMRAAQANSYLPEWLLTGLVGGENPRLYAEQVAPEQRAHIFGLASDNKYLRPVDDPWHFAVKEVEPSVAPDDLDRFGGPAYETYQQLLLLASGIQSAGPRLDAATFQASLRETRFANPGAGRSPLWQAAVGFRAGEHAMVDDVTLVYWDEAANPSGPTRGGFCYVDRGTRHPLGSGPDRAVRFFDTSRPCR